MADKPITFKEAQEALEGVTYKDGWTFELQESESPSEFYIRLSCPVIDVYDGVTPRRAYGRWFPIPYLTKRDVVGTAFTACLMMEEHELREGFKYQGVAVFGPHTDLDTLVAMSGITDSQPDFKTEFLCNCADYPKGWAGFWKKDAAGIPHESRYCPVVGGTEPKRW